MKLNITMSYAGKSIDLPGFHIMSISGRDTFENPQTVRNIPSIPGDRVFSERLEARTITVTIAPISGNTATVRQNRINLLKQAFAIGGENQLIFSDEPDKYFNAYVRSVSPNQIVFYCPDPYKYSTSLKPVPMSTELAHTMKVTNNGTVPCPIRFEITNKGENGYFGISCSEGAMEFGKREDGDATATLTHGLSISDFVSAPDDHTGTDGIHPAYGKAGTMTTKQWGGETYLTLDTIGATAGTSSGALRTVAIPDDTSGHVGIKNFDSYFRIGFLSDHAGQTGEISIAFMTSDDQLIAGCTWYKWDTSGWNGRYQMIVNGGMDNNGRVKGRIINDWEYKTTESHAENPWNKDWGHCMLRKEGAKLTFFYWGHYYDYVIPEVKDMECAKVQISVRSFGGRSGNNLMTKMGFFVLDVRKIDGEMVDVKNRYATGDKITISGEEGKVYVNGMYRPEDEILGTKYFLVPPGDTYILFDISAWCQTMPEIMGYIRERWL